MGIALASNFDVNTALPLDSRTKVADTTARDAIASGVRYEGMVVYVVADGVTYQLVGGTTNGDWVVFGAGGGGGGGGNIEWYPDVNAPLASAENGLRLWEFDSGQTQVLYTGFRVPQGYSEGTQIKMNLLMYSASTSGDIKLETVATLIRPGVDAITAITNQHASTNSAFTTSAGTVDEPNVVDLDLTDADGLINGQAVLPGDLIKIYLVRASDTSASSAKVIQNSTEVISS